MILTKMERKVVVEVARGYLNKEVGGVLGISENTVKSHLQSVVKKTGFRNRTEIALAYVRGRIE